jgi:hypothetical protein
MPISIYIPGPPISTSIILAIEARFNAILPDDYKQFMLHYNGGIMTPNILRIAQGQEFSVKNFLSINNESIVNDIAAQWNCKPTYMSGFLFPIASDFFGNYAAISLRGSRYGSVWVWDHELPVIEGERSFIRRLLGHFRNENEVCVANSFSEFFAKLEDTDTLSDKFERLLYLGRIRNLRIWH